MNEELEAARDAMNKARMAESSLRSKQSTRQYEAVAAAKRAVELEFRDALAKAAEERFSAERRFNAINITAKANEGPEVGTRYVLVKRDRWTKEESINSVAVVEQRTEDTKFAANKQWGLPGVGEKFLRVLNKDGKPGLRFAGLTAWGWTPESEYKPLQK